MVECRKVSKLWHESLEWLSLVKFVLDYGDKLAEYHRSAEEDTEEKVLAIISGWKKGIQKYERTANIQDLRELKYSLGQSLGKCWNGRWNQEQQHWNHPFHYVVCNVQLLKFLFCTPYREESFLLSCESGNVEAAKWILDCFKENGAGFDLNATNDSEKTVFSFGL